MRHVAHVRRHVTVPDATLSSWQSDRHASGHRGEGRPRVGGGASGEPLSAVALPGLRQPGMEDIKHRSDSPSVTHRRHKQGIHTHKSCCRQQVASSAPLHRRQAYVYHSKFDATARPMDKKRCLALHERHARAGLSRRCIAYCQQAAALSASIARGKMADDWTREETRCSLLQIQGMNNHPS